MRLIPLLAILALAALTRGPAKALLPFARFATTTPGAVRYLNIGALLGQKVAVRFAYLPAPGVKGRPDTGFGVQDAHLTFTAFRVSAAQSLLGIGEQHLRLFKFAITRDQPIDGRTNLLSGTASDGVLRGLLGSTTASLAGSSDTGASVGFTSDFLDFPSSTDADLHWVLTSVTPSLAISGANFQPFSSGMVGTFGSSQAPVANVPEAGSLALLCGGALPLLWLRRGHSRRAR